MRIPSSASLILLSATAIAASTSCSNVESDFFSSTMILGDGSTVVLHESDEGQTKWKVQWLDGDDEGEATWDGEVELGSDDRSVVRLSSASFLDVNVKTPDGTREAWFRKNANAELERGFRVDGVETAATPALESWLGDVLTHLSVKSPLGARARAARALAESGPRGLLDLAAGTDSGTVQSIYFELLFEQDDAPLDAGFLAEAAVTIGDNVSSNSSRCEYLSIIARKHVEDDELTAVLARQSARFSSNSNQSEVLREIIQYRHLDDRATREVLESVDSMSSSSAQGETLRALLQHQSPDDDVMEEFLDVVAEISSSSVQGEVLTRVFTDPDTTAVTRRRAVETVDSISSSSTQDSTLRTAIAHSPADQALYRACLDVCTGISSSSSQQSVLTALFEQELDESNLDRAEEVIETISSSSTRAALTTRLQRRRTSR